MKKILFGVAALGLLGLAGAGLGLKAQDTVEAKADEAPTVTTETTFYVDLSAFDEWKNLTTGFYLHAFDANNGDALTTKAAWPGDLINNPVSDGILPVTVPENTTHFIVNRGKDARQTVNIHISEINGSTFTLASALSGDKVTGNWDSQNGWYLAGDFNSWGRNATSSHKATLQDGVYTWNNIAISTNQKFKVVKHQDGYFYNDSWKGWLKIADKSAASVYFTEEGDSPDNDIKATFGGTFNVTYNESTDGIGLVASDRTAVDHFVATYITDQAAQDYREVAEGDRAASCADKYNNAKTALLALSDDQKALFNTSGDYASARAAYAIWEASASGGEAKAVSAFTSQEENGTSLTVSIVLAAAAILGVGAFGFYRKRRAE